MDLQFAKLKTFWFIREIKFPQKSFFFWQIRKISFSVSCQKIFRCKNIGFFLFFFAFRKEKQAFLDPEGDDESEEDEDVFLPDDRNIFNIFNNADEED